MVVAVANMRYPSCVDFGGFPPSPIVPVILDAYDVCRDDKRKNERRTYATQLDLRVHKLAADLAVFLQICNKYSIDAPPSSSGLLGLALRGINALYEHGKHLLCVDQLPTHVCTSVRQVQSQEVQVVPHSAALE